MSKGGSRRDRWHYIACFSHWLAFGTMPQPVFRPGRRMARCQNGLWEHSKAHRRSELQFMMGLCIPETWNLRFRSWSIPGRDNSPKGSSASKTHGALLLAMTMHTLGNGSFPVIASATKQSFFAVRTKANISSAHSAGLWKLWRNRLRANRVEFCI